MKKGMPDDSKKRSSQRSTKVGSEKANQIAKSADPPTENTSIISPLNRGDDEPEERGMYGGFPPGHPLRPRF